MEKKTPPAADSAPSDHRRPADPDRDRPLVPSDRDLAVLQADRDRPLIEDDSLDGPGVEAVPAEIAAPDRSDLEVRGRRYRLAVGDGSIGIWDRRSGEQVGTFMEDAFTAAWARYLELEQARSLGGVLDRTADLLRRRWYVVVVVVLGALTVGYLRSVDPSLSPTLIRQGAAPELVTPQVARSIALVGPSVARGLDTAPAVSPTDRSKGPDRRPKVGGSRGAGQPGGNGTGAGPAGTSSAGTNPGSPPSGSGSGDPGGTGGTDPGGNGSGDDPPPPSPPPSPVEPPPPDA
jgi:hypothetical protein